MILDKIRDLIADGGDAKPRFACQCLRADRVLARSLRSHQPPHPNFTYTKKISHSFVATFFSCAAVGCNSCASCCNQELQRYECVSLHEIFLKFRASALRKFRNFRSKGPPKREISGQRANGALCFVFEIRPDFKYMGVKGHENLQIFGQRDLRNAKFRVKGRSLPRKLFRAAPSSQIFFSATAPKVSARNLLIAIVVCSQQARNRGGVAEHSSRNTATSRSPDREPRASTLGVRSGDRATESANSRLDPGSWDRRSQDPGFDLRGGDPILLGSPYRAGGAPRFRTYGTERGPTLRSGGAGPAPYAPAIF